LVSPPGNQIGTEGAKAFAEALCVNTSVKYLDISGAICLLFGFADDSNRKLHWRLGRD
jgi:hypothetical protein